jgi:hypothetical protein
VRRIHRIRFGSHLYGTSTPASDIDFKSIFVPEARSILLQRAKGAINEQRPKQEFEKNVAGEVEEERFSVQRYLSLLAEGQTVALDVLFAPEWSWTAPPAPEWHEIFENRHRLLTRKSRAFIGYAMRQASKYGVKGSRVASARKALAYLVAGEGEFGAQAKLERLEAGIELMTTETEHMAVVPQIMPNGMEVLHWEVCGRKMPFTSSIKNAREVMQRLVDEYGKRALQAESNQGVDWKALSHAVRVGHQALELLSTGHVTFPLPNREHVHAIKLGQHDYKDVASEIEDLLPQIEAAAQTSALPEEPDLEWIDDFVARVHRSEVCR